MQTTLRRSSQLPGLTPWLSAAVIVAFLAPVSGCRRSEKRPPPVSEESLEAPAPSAPASLAQGRCAQLASVPTLLVGAQGGRAEAASSKEGDDSEDTLLGESSVRGAVEFAAGATDGSAFILGLLNHAEDSRALVAFIDAAGARLVDLGRVDPNGEPPRVAALGGHYLALVTDASSSPPRLRLVGLAKNGAAIEARLGPEVRRGARDGQGADVAVLASGQALVVWERSNSPDTSEIVGLPVDAPSLREKAGPSPLTPPGQVASVPRVLAGAQGFWLLWLIEQAAPPAIVEGDGTGLLVEPPSVLHVRQLDALGKPLGAPIAINGGAPAALVFDARVLPSGRLLVVHRAAPADRPTDDEPVHLSIIEPGAAGPIPSFEVRDLSGPGVPLLLGLPGADVSFLAIEDASGKSALARVLADGTAEGIPMAGLEGRVAVAGEPGRLLTAQPRGIGVMLEVLGCTSN